jgi:hypothetical protein
MLVINRCFEGEPDVAGLAERWKGHLTDGPVRIERRDSIERLSRTYQFGSIARDRYLWDRIEEISKMPLRTDAVPPPPPLPESAHDTAEVEGRQLPALAASVAEHKE